MNFYDIFCEYLMPHFVDLSLYPYAEQAFFYVFCAVSIAIVLGVFLITPIRIFGDIFGLRKRRCKRRLK